MYYIILNTGNWLLFWQKSIEIYNVFVLVAGDEYLKTNSWTVIICLKTVVPVSELQWSCLLKNVNLLPDSCTY